LNWNNSTFRTVVKAQRMKKVLLAIVVFFILNFVVLALKVNAQNEGDDTIEMADKMRSEGKIYVVVLVVVILFVGLLFYTISTDRKVTRLEKEVERLKNTKCLKT